MPLEVWKSVFEIGGVALLFLTFVSGAGVVLTTNRLNERQAERLREFDKQLTDAKTELVKQQGRAATAEIELNRVANTAGAANERAAKLEIEAASQRERAARAEKDLLELRERTAWRRLPVDQQYKLTELLKKFGTAPINLNVSAAGGQEAITLRDDIMVAITSAGIQMPRRELMLDANVPGGGIGIKRGQNREAEAEAIADFFISVGLAKKPVPGEMTPDASELTIVVGSKPAPK